ncbi:hypothetical protein CRE_14219 [Caenorhabditis remanei]|uniref:FHA domain-containing protein n=1 Tax=Caenorhabditis remanei TaxID=31234 RepID=E3N1I2_CAERE|nr:hypothetical protein CRE_14219 [Caenorhabditis remanei]
MGDKLDSTIDAVASMSRSTDFPSSTKKSDVLKDEKRIEDHHINPEMSRKRKVDNTEFLARPDTLTDRKRWKIEEDIDVLEDSKPCASTSTTLHTPHQRESSSISNQSLEESDRLERGESSEISDSQKKRVDMERTRNKTSHREPSITESDPMKIWTASDDLSLITAVSHVSCLRFIHNSLPFSRKFSYSDLEERFCQLMYDEKLSELARKRISGMTERQRLHIESRTPFTRNEERCLMDSAEKRLKSQRNDKNDPDNHTILTIDHFKTILDDNRSTFHQSRTPQVLSDHFRRIKGYRDTSKESEKNSYEALESNKEVLQVDFDINVPMQSCRARYYAIARRPAFRGIQSRFQTSATVPDNAIAIIHGQFLQYAMTGKMVVMGRASMYDKVDIDLSKEGPAAKVSRQQAVICNVADGEFSIENIGQRPMYVDSKPLPQMVSTSLKHGSIIEIASLRLIFSIPVPRVLHPLTRQIAFQQRRTQQEKNNQNYQRSSPGGLGGPSSSTSKKPRPKPNPAGGSSTTTVHKSIRKTDFGEKEQLVKAVQEISQDP